MYISRYVICIFMRCYLHIYDMCMFAPGSCQDKRVTNAKKTYLFGTGLLLHGLKYVVSFPTKP